MQRPAETGRATTARRPQARQAERASSLVDEASEDSFPASDPPAFTVCGAGTPNGRTSRKPASKPS